MSIAPRDRTLYRLPLMVAAMLCLMAALWAGLQRFGWALPALQPALPMAHGPLMVCGFLGTLISLERAVALQRVWAYEAPLLTGLGGLLLVLGVGAGAGPFLITAGSAVLVVVFGVLLGRQGARFMQVMAAGALAWLAGNVGWLFGAAVPEVVNWWLGFLVLTIAGERLELSRMLVHGAGVERRFGYGVTALVAGLVAASLTPDAGIRVTGAALVVLALWLARYDVARYTVRREGLTRYVGWCLLAGYAWLLVGGALMVYAGYEGAGPAYDAYLHAVFVGFVFSMIFGHAPIIFPSVLGVPIFYRAFFYVPLALLHVSLVVRTAGNLGLWHDARIWGGMGTAVAVVLFLASVLYAVLTTRDVSFPAPYASDGRTAGAGASRAERILKP